MNSQAIAIENYTTKKNNSFSLISWVNNFAKREKTNALGITVMYIMVGSGIASLTAALSVYDGVSIPILIISSFLAMGTNAAVISQQTFKFSTWFFIVNVVINTALLFYQIFTL
jgi:hypothetical protein